MVAATHHFNIGLSNPINIYPAYMLVIFENLALAYFFERMQFDMLLVVVVHINLYCLGLLPLYRQRGVYLKNISSSFCVEQRKQVEILAVSILLHGMKLGKSINFLQSVFCSDIIVENGDVV